MIKAILAVLVLVGSGFGALGALRGCTEPVDAQSLASLPHCEKDLLSSGAGRIRRGEPISATEVKWVREACENSQRTEGNQALISAQQNALAK